MRRYVVDLYITAPELLSYYRGAARTVLARARSGERVRFPADALRAHVDRQGVRGTFALHVDGSNRLRQVQRLR